MTVNSLALLRRAVRNKEPVRVRRRFRGLSNVYGVPLKLSKQFVLLHVMDNFRLDGFAVLPLAHVRDVRMANLDRFAKRVLEDTKQWPLVGRDAPQLKLNDWPSLFRSLANRVEIVTVECERPKDDEYLVGTIVGATERKLGLHYFDAAAKWDELPIAVPYREVTQVRFLDAYSQVLARYLGPRPQSDH